MHACYAAFGMAVDRAGKWTPTGPGITLFARKRPATAGIGKREDKDGRTRRHSRNDDGRALGDRLRFHRGTILASRRLLLFRRYPQEPPLPPAAGRHAG